MTLSRFDAARVSLTGDRMSNQDRSLLLRAGASTVLALADGLGGHPRGEVAAQLFVDVCESLLRRSDRPLRNPGQFMTECIHSAHTAIIGFGNRQVPPISPRTTAVIAVLQAGVAYWAHVGDSRLYLVRDGKLLSRTHDHTRIRYIRPAHGAVCKPRCSITRCLGGADKPPVVSLGRPTELLVGDAILLCSDGLWGQIPQRNMLRALSLSSGLNNAVAKLAEQAARRAYPHSDNVSAVGLRWDPGMPHDKQANRVERQRSRISTTQHRFF